jgi:hypothetical protein
MFAWRRCPRLSRRRQHAVRNPDGRESGVVVSPGVAFGEHGEGYVHIAMVENEQRIRQAARGVRRFLESGLETLHVVPRQPALGMIPKSMSAGLTGGCRRFSDRIMPSYNVSGRFFASWSHP